MKSVYCFYIFVFIVLLSRDTNGRVLKSFFEKVHDTAHKVHDDIHNAFRPTEAPKKESVVFQLPDNNKKEEPMFVFATSTIGTNKEINKEVNVDQSYKPKDGKDTSDGQLFFASNPTIQPAVNSTTTEKNGRENFAGGCSTGYQRTADGRCKPTF